MTTETNYYTATPFFSSDEQSSSLILNNLQDSYILLNRDFCVVYFNKAAREGIRQYLDLEIHTGMHLFKLAKESRRTKLIEIITNALLGKPQITENRFTLKDGNQIYFENTFLPAYDAKNRIAGIIISSKDITEQKRTRQAIQDSEKRLQFALEAASQGAWDWNLQTNEVVYSESYKKLYGFEDNELKNDVSEWMTRIHPEDQDRMQKSVSEHLQANNEDYLSEYRIRAKDGTYRWVMAKGRLTEFDESGKPLRMTGTHTDITEAVEREQALKLINERFDCMVKATHELLWEWDIVTNRILRSKEGIMNVYGFGNNQTYRNHESWFERLHPEDRLRMKAMLKEILNAPHQQTFEMEYRFLRANGNYAHIYDRCILLRDENNKPMRVIGAAQDISERKRLEKELLQNELAYQRMIHQATVNSQEEERAEIGKELHDNVNQVLTTTKLYLDLASTNSELKDELIRKSLLNINNVIQEIRHLSRSLMDPSIGDLGLMESIKDLIENIQLTGKVNIRLSEAGPVENLLDANQKLTIFRIVQESLNNVLRHAGADTVSIYFHGEKDLVSLIIQDNGVGFHPEQIKKGAGLKNIENRIYLINGNLQIKSSPGKGCTLEIHFPIKKTQ